MKMKWEAKLAAIAAMKGIKDYEEWAMGLTPELPPTQGAVEGFHYTMDWTSPEEMFAGPKTDKELLFEKAVEIRRQLDEAIGADDYERAGALQKLLDVIETKYNKL